MIRKLKPFTGPIALVVIGFIVLLSITSRSFDATKYNANNEYQTISELTSSKYHGRLAGTEGNTMALKYVEDNFKKLGIAPGGENGTYYQEFKSMVPMYNSTPYFRIKDANGKVIKDFTLGKDYIENLSGFGGSGEAAGKLFYATDALNNYDPALIRGKIIVSNSELDDFSAEYAIDNGIKCVISLSTHVLQKTYTNISDKPGKTLLRYSFNEKAFNELVKYTNNNYSIDTKLDEPYKYVNTPNIFGKIEGRKKSSGYIIFSTHIDSFGDIPGSNICYLGARDGASGTALLLELAKAIKDQKHKPDKTILFAIWNNEEYGMKGKEYYLQNPIYPLKNTTLFYFNNLGMNSEPYFEFGYSGQEGKILKDKLSQFTSTFVKQYNPYAAYGSDVEIKNNPFPIKAFADKGVFAVFMQEFQINFHGDYGADVSGGRTLYPGSINDNMSLISVKQLSAETSCLLNFIKKEIQGDIYSGLLHPNETVLALVLLILAILIYAINTAYKINPDLRIFKITIENIYYSSFYRLLDKLISSFLQIGLIFLLIVFINHLPLDFNLFNINGNLYTNFSWSQVTNSTMEYIRMLFTSGFGKAATGTNINDYFLDAFIKSFSLLGAVLFFGIILGIAKGIYDAFKEDGHKSDLRTIGTIVMFSLPDVLVVIAVQFFFIFIYHHNIINVPMEYRDQKIFVETFLSLILLPSIYITRISSVAVYEELKKEYIKAAKARGLSNLMIIRKHLLIAVFTKVVDSLPSILTLIISNMIIAEYFSGYRGIFSTLTGDKNSTTAQFICIYLLYLSFLFIFRSISKFVNPLKRREI